MKYTYFDGQNIKREFEIKEFNFLRPDSLQILSDYKKHNSDISHPRIMADEGAFARIKKELRSDEKLKFMFERLKEEVDLSLDITEVLQFTEKCREDGFPAGNWYCPKYKNRLRDFSFMWQITGEEKYAKAAYEIMNSLSDVKDWHPQEFLICSELMTHMAIAYDWCFDYLKNIDGALSKIETAIFEKGIMAGVTAYQGTCDNAWGRRGWIDADSNWNQISNSGLGVAALSVIDKYPSECSYLLQNVLLSLEKSFFAYASNGGYHEGPSYWAYGTSYVSYFIMTLDSVLGTNYGLFDVPGFSDTCYYKPYVMGTSKNPDEPAAKMHWNYHDSGTGLISSEMFMWFSYKTKDPSLATIRYNEIKETYDNGISRNMFAFETATAYDFIYYDKNLVKESVELPLDKYFKGLEMVFMRSGWNNPDAIYTGLHAGINNFNHCQLDSGNFIIDAKGIRWITELGMGNYVLPGYFEPKATDPRWTYYSSRAESHNTLIINPDKGPDQVVDSFSPIIRFESGEKSALAIADLTEANGKEKVHSAKRGLLFTNNRTAIVVQDEVQMTKPSEVYWFALTTCDIDIKLSEDGKTACLSKDGHRMLVKIVSDKIDAKFEVVPAVKLPTSTPMHQLESKNENYKKLAIHLTNVSEIQMSVVFQFPKEEKQQSEYNYKISKMADWRIDE